MARPARPVPTDAHPGASSYHSSSGAGGRPLPSPAGFWADPAFRSRNRVRLSAEQDIRKRLMLTPRGQPVNLRAAAREFGSASLYRVISILRAKGWIIRPSRSRIRYTYILEHSPSPDYSNLDEREALHALYEEIQRPE